MTAKNRLLEALPKPLLEKLAPALKQVPMNLGDHLHEPGKTITTLYFPLDCVLSINLIMSDGLTAETGLIGNREVLGINAFMGGRETTQTTYIVQLPGTALEIEAQFLQSEFDCNQELRDVLLRYTQAFIAQVSQTAACNSLHTLERRLARWLLEVHDRIEGDKLALTQDFMADMLGVRRAGVTQTAQKLQERNLIYYNRGQVEILDRPGLEAFSCECFHMLRGEYDRLLGSRNESLS